MSAQAKYIIAKNSKTGKTEFFLGKIGLQN